MKILLSFAFTAVALFSPSLKAATNSVLSNYAGYYSGSATVSGSGLSYTGSTDVVIAETARNRGVILFLSTINVSGTATSFSEIFRITRPTRASYSVGLGPVAGTSSLRVNQKSRRITVRGTVTVSSVFYQVNSVIRRVGNRLLVKTTLVGTNGATFTYRLKRRG